MFNLLTILVENLGFQCVQDNGNFGSLQIGVGLLKISPFGETCPCGTKCSSSFESQDILKINGKSDNNNGDENVDSLTRTFCGLFCDELSHLTHQVTTPEKGLSGDSNFKSADYASQPVVSSQRLKPNQFLPPLCRKDYYVAYRAGCSDNNHLLAFWADNIFSKEAEENSKESEKRQDLRTYSFARFFVGEVTLNFTANIFHILELFLDILIEGSKCYKPCADWDLLNALPPLEPMDRRFTQMEMLKMGRYTPNKAIRGHVVSTQLNIFPPKYVYQSTSPFSVLNIKMDNIEVFVIAPIDSVRLVFRMTHLYPSAGVLSEVNTSFHEWVILESLFDSKYWGDKDFTSGTCGTFETIRRQVEGNDGICVALENENATTRALQADLLNRCYVRRLVTISNVQICLGLEKLISPVSVTLSQRNLLFVNSWPHRILKDLVETESCLKSTPKIVLRCNSVILRSLVAYGMYLHVYGGAVASALSHYVNGQRPEACHYGVQLNEVALAHLEELNDARLTNNLTLDITSSGSICLHFQSGKTKTFFSATLEGPDLTGNLVEIANNGVIPVFEGLTGCSKGILSCEIERKVIPALDCLCPSSLTLMVSPIKFLVTSTLLNWFTDIVSAFKKAFEIFETETSIAPFPGLGTCSKSQNSISCSHEESLIRSSDRALSSDDEKTFTSSEPSSSSFSEWLVANYKWLTTCDVELVVSGSTFYLCPIKNHFCIGGLEVWLASLDPPNRTKLTQFTLYRMALRGPHSRLSPLSAVIPSAREMNETRFSGFEVEESDSAESLQRQSSQSVHDKGTPSLDPNSTSWDCNITKIKLFVGDTSCPLEALELSCLLLFVLSTKQLNDVLSGISWNSYLRITQNSSCAWGDAPSLRQIAQLAVAVSDTQAQFANLVDETLKVVELAKSYCSALKGTRVRSDLLSSVEFAQSSCELTGSAKRLFPVASHASQLLSHQWAESKRRSEHRTSPFPSPNVANVIPVTGCIRVSLPVASGNFRLVNEKSMISWEIEDFSVKIFITDPLSAMRLSLKLDRASVFLRSPERCFPLIGPKHQFLKPFQIVTPCPGMGPYKRVQITQGRHKLNETQDTDSNDGADVTSSRQSQPALFVSLIRSPASFVRHTFAGKRFSRWVDSRCEQFLRDGDLVVDNACPPFINCVYARLKPLDLVFCPQIARIVQGILSEFGFQRKVKLNCGDGEKKVKAPLPGHCMPLMFLAVDELRLFFPSPGLLDLPEKFEDSPNTLVITLLAIRLYPFPVNCITTRPHSKSSSESTVTLTNEIGAPHEDRQYALRFEGFTCWAVNLLASLNSSGHPHLQEHKPILTGQYPAFEWNQAATHEGEIDGAVWVLPVLRPLDVLFTFAAPVCETSLNFGQSRFLFGSTLEVNVRHDVVFTLGTSFLSMYLQNLLGGTTKATPEEDTSPAYHTLLGNNQPTRILLTCGLLRFVLWEKSGCSEHQWDFSVLDIIQPHFLWTADALNVGLHNLQVHLRSFIEGRESDWQSSTFWSPTPPGGSCRPIPSRLPLPRVTELGPCDIVGASVVLNSPNERACFSTSGRLEFLSIRLVRHESMAGRFEVTTRLQREVELILTPVMLRCLSTLTETLGTLGSGAQSTKSVHELRAPFIAIATTFHHLNLYTCPITARLIAGSDEFRVTTEHLQLEASVSGLNGWMRLCVDLTADLTDAYLNNFQLIPTGMGISCKACVELSNVSIPVTRVQVEVSRGTKFLVPLGDDFGRITRAFAALSSKRDAAVATVPTSAPQRLPSRCVFVDDLRSESTYKVSASVLPRPSGSRPAPRHLPLPYEIMLADHDQFASEDANERCATMTWTFPEPRQPLRLIINPVPFFYENDLVDPSNIELPGRLEYWIEHPSGHGRFVTYANFSLCESASVNVILPPGLCEFRDSEPVLQHVQKQELVSSVCGIDNVFWGSQSKLNTTTKLPVAASSWRIIVNCVAENTSMMNCANPEYEPTVVPVFISPYALAACVQLDSAYIPELVAPMSLHVGMDDSSISAWQAGIELCRVTTSGLRGVVTLAYAHLFKQPSELSQGVDSITAHHVCAYPRLASGFSVSSVDGHIFSAHAAHLQRLGTLRRVYGVTGHNVSIETCYLCVSSDIIHALKRITTGVGATGWCIRNRTDRRLFVQQCLSSKLAGEPAAQALLDVVSASVEAEESLPSWRPLTSLGAGQGAQTITIRLGLSVGVDEVIWSTPLSLDWPPVHKNHYTNKLIKWSGHAGNSNSLPHVTLILPRRHSSGLPGEVVIQSGFTLQNNLPFDLVVKHPKGPSKCVASNSSHVPCLSPKTAEIFLTISGSDEPLTWTSIDLATSEIKVLWLPVAGILCPVLVEVEHLHDSSHNLAATELTLSPVLSITNKFPMPLNLIIKSPHTSSASFLTSPGLKGSEFFNIPKETTAPVVVAFEACTQPEFLFQFPDKTPVFESSLSLPWREKTGLLSVVVKPWLILSNRSGINLRLLTSASLELVGNPQKSSINFNTDSCFVPPAGERLFRFGIDQGCSTTWSPALLVHKSVFLSRKTTDAPSSNTITLIAGSTKTSTANVVGFEDRPNTVMSLTDSSPFASLSLPLGQTVCGLCVRLNSGLGDVATVGIEPLVCMVNRTSQPILCKPIVTPVVSMSDEKQRLPTVSVEDLGIEVLTLPPFAKNPTPVLLWNCSHPNVACRDIDLKGILFAHVLVLRSQLGVFWSRSLQLFEVFSTDGVRCFSHTKQVRRYYHLSLPSFDEEGNMDECSILLTISNDSSSGLWMIYLDDFASSLSYSLGCSVVNTTSHTFETAIVGLQLFHQLPISNSLPCLYRDKGRVTLISQTSLDLLAADTPKSRLVSKFLTFEDVSILLRLVPEEIVVRLADCRNSPLPLHIGNKVVYIQSYVNHAIPFYVELEIFSHQPPTRIPVSLVESTRSFSVYVDTFSIFALRSGCLSEGSEPRQVDFLRLSIRSIEFTLLFEYGIPRSKFTFSSSLIQLDNLAQVYTPTLDFPVILRSVISQVAEIDTTGLFVCSGQLHHLPFGDFLFEKIDIKLPVMEVYLEDGAMYALLSWAQDLRGAMSQRIIKANNLEPSTRIAYCLHDFEIHPILLQVSLKFTLGVHISCKTVQLQLNAFKLPKAVAPLATLLGQLGAHYISQALLRVGLVLGGLELIGNPASLVASFAEGFSDLVHFSDIRKTTNQEQLGFLRGLMRGLVSLMKHTTGGLCSSVTGLASNFARNLHELSMDAEHIRRVTETRQRNQPQGIGQGLAIGLSELGMSLLGGLAGIAHHPLHSVIGINNCPVHNANAQAGQRQSVEVSGVAEALVGGVGKGLVGIVAKPLAGMADLVAMTGTGIMHSMDPDWGVASFPTHLRSPAIWTSASRLVDGVLLRQWVCALVRRLNAPPTHDFLWCGIAQHESRATLTWLCLPFRNFLFAVEFQFPLQLIRTGVIQIEVDDEGYVDENDTSLASFVSMASEMPSWISQCKILPAEKVLLQRILRHYQCKNSSAVNEQIFGESPVSQLERVRAYLLSLPRHEA
uniref:VPS13_C domain-containing protein n=2 Tax=Mesocestoides corti TaxID=53468 RepID=A0A5K3F779_MESCO